jgi:hypothetical protein
MHTLLLLTNHNSQLQEMLTAYLNTFYLTTLTSYSNMKYFIWYKLALFHIFNGGNYKTLQNYQNLVLVMN